MAGVVAAADAACWISASISVSSSTVTESSRGSNSGVGFGVRRLNLHGGLKAQNDLMAMGKSVSTEQQFANMRTNCHSVRTSQAGTARGGAAASACSVGSEILTVIPIMSALVLIGVALGFVLLRVEAFIEESEE